MKANHGKDSGREGIIVAARQDYREMRTVSSGDGSFGEAVKRQKQESKPRYPQTRRPGDRVTLPRNAGYETER